ncbi:MAG TPA: hydrogenase/urease maturation nickel metallochaperone HypA [Candidatus Omnitrophota bacterium]|nr:hydrogenase/urease maturation nickel metallochaperone HypA [Candidatus Omnitrophota bacterium]
MHETTLIANMLSVVARVRDEQKKKVKRITVEIPEFGMMSQEHFRYHFEEEIKGTEWEGLLLEIKKVPSGVDARLVGVTFSS